MSETLSAQEAALRRHRVSMKSKEHMIRWLEETGRRYLLLDAKDLVDALPFPDGCEALQVILRYYADHRASLPTGKSELTEIHDAKTGQPMKVELPTFKSEVLEVVELDRAIRYLINQASQRDPTWDLNNPPL